MLWETLAYLVPKEDANQKDMLKSNFKDTSVYEQAAEEFGITAMYEEYNATLETTFLDDLANKHQDSLIEDIGKSMAAFQQKTQRRTQSEPSKQLETPQKKTEFEA